jgi:hypothetical protein
MITHLLTGDSMIETPNPIPIPTGAANEKVIMRAQATHILCIPSFKMTPKENAEINS